MTAIIQKIRRYKINIFDIAVICLIIAVTFVFLWLRFTKKTEWISVRIVVANDDWWYEGQPPQWWYVDDLKIGQSSYNSFGEKIAELTNVEVFDTGGYKRRAFVDFKLKGAFDKNRQLYLYNFQPLQIGKPLDLTFGKNNLRGQVIYIDKIPSTYLDKRIAIKLFTIRPWIADSYKPGLQMKDSLGRVLATIDKVDIETAAYYEFSDIRGEKIKISDPNLRDVTVYLTIKTFNSGDNNYFVDRAAIKIGEKIWFQFSQAVIRDAEIVNIFE